MTDRRPRRRRHHAAAASRVLVSGLAIASTLGMVAGIATNHTVATGTAAVPSPTTPVTPANALTPRRATPAATQTVTRPAPVTTTKAS